MFGFFFYQEYEEGHREWLANKYNATIIEYVVRLAEQGDDINEILSELKEIGTEDADDLHALTSVRAGNRKRDLLPSPTSYAGLFRRPGVCPRGSP